MRRHIAKTAAQGPVGQWEWGVMGPTLHSPRESHCGPTAWLRSGENVSKPSKQTKTAKLKLNAFWKRPDLRGERCHSRQLPGKVTRGPATSDALAAGRVPHREGRREMVFWHKPRRSIGRSCTPLRIAFRHFYLGTGEGNEHINTHELS